MAFISLRQLLDHAAENGYGVPAFNITNLVQIQAIMEAAQAGGSTVFLQAPAGARGFTSVMPVPLDELAARYKKSLPGRTGLKRAG